MADQTLPGFTHKDEDADVNRFIKDQVDDLFDFMRDAEPEQKKAIARLLIGEVLRRFDAEFADGVAKLATNYGARFRARDRAVRRALIRTAEGRHNRPYRH